jgi:hypothetical protein
MTLRWNQYLSCKTFLPRVHDDMIDPRAHRIAPHQPGIAGLQQFGRRSHILHSRIKPSCLDRE